MKIFLSLLFVLTCFSANAQNIIGAEYFIDNDKGFGQNTPIDIELPVQSNDVKLNFDVNLNQVVLGMHHLYVRVKDANNQWSLKSTTPILVIKNQVALNITDVEYFIDDDPGIGNGIAVGIASESSDVSLVVEPDLSLLESGMHNLYVRAKSADEKLSLLQNQMFYVAKTEDVVLVDRFEYYFERDTWQSSIFVFDDFTAASIVELDVMDFMANVSELEYENDYTLYVRAMNTNGNYGEYQTVNFTFKNLATSIDLDKSVKVQIYPNPVVNRLYIKNVSINSKVKYALYNLEGKRIDEGILVENSINVDNLMSGVYYLILQDGNTLYKSEAILKN